jgi:hypothetical protein
MRLVHAEDVAPAALLSKHCLLSDARKIPICQQA